MKKNVEDIIELIGNLLDLSHNNPNEFEARDAALKAQKLMKKYKVAMADVTDRDDETVEVIRREVAVSGNYNTWRFGLAKIVADNFCTRIAVSSTRKRDIIFFGTPEDTKVSAETYTFLFTIGNRLADRFYNKQKLEGKPTRGVANSYLQGFTAGIKEALDEQCKALVLVVPEEVDKYYNESINPSKTSHVTIRTNASNIGYDEGKVDGKNCMQSRYIEEA